jgi:hypothetical protein
MTVQLGQQVLRFKYSKTTYLAGAGIQTAALAFGGAGSPPFNTGATEEYDGTTWTTSPASLNTARDALAGAGTQTSAFSFWWLYSSSVQQQQKNGQVQEHH